LTVVALSSLRPRLAQPPGLSPDREVPDDRDHYYRRSRSHPALRYVQEAASQADPRTTMRYDRARGSLDRHATYIVAAYVAGAAR
jgi:integrase/recombinase XerD